MSEQKTGNIATAPMASPRRWGRLAPALLPLVLLACLCAPASASAEPPLLWQACDGGPADIQCSIPRGIAADPLTGRVFVADSLNDRIVEFTPSGQFVKAWGWDVVASGPGDDTIPPEDQFERCLAERGDVCKGGTVGPGSGQFGNFGPQGIALDSAGNVYVVDQANHRVETFDRRGNFLFMFGGDVNKTKVEAAAPEAQQNLCPVDPGDVCQAGTQGTGKGQFGAWAVGSFIAVDGKGTITEADDAVWVGENERIQRFDTAGHYVEDWPDGGGALAGRTVQSLAVDSAGDLYAAFVAQQPVRKLTPAGAMLVSPSFKIPEPDEFTKPVPTAIAVGPSGDLFAFSNLGTKNGFIPIDRLYEFDAGANLVESFGEQEFNESTGLATNICPGSEAPGNLYVSNGSAGGANSFVRAYGTDPSGCGTVKTAAATAVAETTATLHGSVNPNGVAVTDCTFEYGLTVAPYEGSVDCAESPASLGTGTSPVPVHADLSGLAAGTVYHFRLSASNFEGTESGDDATLKTTGPPVLAEEFASDVAYTEATLNATVNPEGFPAIYHFEYTTQADFDLNGFSGAQSTPDLPLTGDRAGHVTAANLSGLEPGTAYRWRIVADNTAVANGGTTIGSDHSFTTYRFPQPETDCPNQNLRTGPAALLPDCRAYEMVSPADKNGGDIDVRGAYVQASPDGARLTYPAHPAFGELEGVVVSNQYLAERDPEAGWSNRGIRPPVRGRPVIPNFGVFREFMAFSPDLCSAWFMDTVSPPLTAAGQDGFLNHYRLDLCSPFDPPEALTSVPPPPGTNFVYVNLITRAVLGYSDDASHAFFVAGAKLAERAAPGSSSQLYDRFQGDLHLVSIKPNGSPETVAARLGSGVVNNLVNAVSADGERVYWTGGGGTSDVPPNGKVYLRLHPGQDGEEPADECAIPEFSACTIPVSTGNEAFFWAGARDGSGALYSEGGDLFAFDLEAYEAGEPSRRLIAHHVTGVLGAGDDLSHVYFVSTDDLTGGQQNSEGDQAQAGQPNLYLDQDGVETFVAPLSPADVLTQGLGEGISYTLTASSPEIRPVRVSPDGTHLAFQSRASLTGFDNVDPVNGEANVEVFRYEAGGPLDCVSCNPSGAAPHGSDLGVPYGRTPVKSGVFAAAWIPAWEHSTYASRVLSDDGGRLFFQSYEGLVPTDDNGVLDVYEWEAPGTGSCTEGKAAFHELNGGCVYLISSGEGALRSEFYDASADGSHVFFNTESSFLPRDLGLIDLYDAHVGGGFAEPTPTAACEGEACQSPPAPPARVTPASSSFQGAGNVVESPPRRKRCPKGKKPVKKHGKVRCVKKQDRHRDGNNRRAKHDRRAAR